MAYKISYTYDAAGNRSTKTETRDGTTTVTTYTYDAANQLVNEVSPAGTITYTYDGAGNCTLKETPEGDTHTTFDAANQATTIEPPSGPVDFTYNAFYQRVRKDATANTSGGDITKFIYDHKRLLAETDDSDVTTKSYTSCTQNPAFSATGEYGDLIGEYDNDELTNAYPDYDAQWNTKELLDDTGDPTASYRNTAFGLQSPEAQPDWCGMSNDQWDHLSEPGWDDLPACTPKGPNGYGGQAGYYHDEELELYILGMGGRGRYYDPALGRFTSQDPSNLAGGDTNLYRYVHNNPVNGVDPDGNGAGAWFWDNVVAPTTGAPTTREAAIAVVQGIQQGQRQLNQLQQQGQQLQQQAAGHAIAGLNQLNRARRQALPMINQGLQAANPFTMPSRLQNTVSQAILAYQAGRRRMSSPATQPGIPSPWFDNSPVKYISTPDDAIVPEIFLGRVPFKISDDLEYVAQVLADPAVAETRLVLSGHADGSGRTSFFFGPRTHAEGEDDPRERLTLKLLEEIQRYQRNRRSVSPARGAQLASYHETLQTLFGNVSDEVTFLSCNTFSGPSGFRFGQMFRELGYLDEGCSVHGYNNFVGSDASSQDAFDRRLEAWYTNVFSAELNYPFSNLPHRFAFDSNPANDEYDEISNPDTFSHKVTSPHQSTPPGYGYLASSAFIYRSLFETQWPTLTGNVSALYSGVRSGHSPGRIALTYGGALLSQQQSMVDDVTEFARRYPGNVWAIQVFEMRLALLQADQEAQRAGLTPAQLAAVQRTIRSLDGIIDQIERLSLPSAVGVVSLGLSLTQLYHQFSSGWGTLPAAVRSRVPMPSSPQAAWDQGVDFFKDVTEFH